MASIFNFRRSQIRPLLILLGVVVCASTVVGQKAKRLPGVITDRQELNRAKVAANDALRGAFTTAKQNALGKYYAHIIAGMTTPQAAADLPKLRATLNYATSRAGSPQTQKYLTDLFYSGLTTIANPTKGYSFVAQYNATLALGDLNSREEKRTGRRIDQRVVPHAKAREFLHKLLKTKPSAIHVACMIGLKRHATALAEDPSQQQDKRIGAYMLDVINRTEPPAGITQDGHLWMKRIAVETLGCMRNPAIASILIPIAEDPEASLGLRCAAVEALGRLAFKKNADPKLTAIIGAVAVEACKAEVTRLTLELDPDGSGGRRSRFSEGAGRFGSVRDEVNPVVQRTRRQLLGDLYCVGTSLKAIKDELPAEKQAEAEVLLKEVSKMANMLKREATEFRPEELLERLAADTTTLEAVVQR